MSLKDVLGIELSGANSRAIGHYERAIRQLQCVRGDPIASADAAIAEAPGFAMAHAVRAWAHLLGTELSGLPNAREAHALAAATAGTARERAHVAALGLLLEGRWHRSARVLEDCTIAEPRDALGLLVGHQLDFFTGHSRMLRDRIARALPAWDEGVPGYHSILGMAAFGLEETCDYSRAEAIGRRAVELEPLDGWAQHAVAHVLEMQCRQHDGIAWMRGNPAAWSSESYLAVHNWWHLALFHYDLTDYATTLSLYDREMGGGTSSVVLDMIDASALLFRLQLRGVDVSDRWQVLADAWAPVATACNYSFNDAHAVMALVGAGRLEAARAVLAAQETSMRRDDDNASFTREVGHAVARAFLAFGEEDYPRTVSLLREVRSIAHRFGGSHAQRDILDLTLLEAAFRAGQTGLAAALATERQETRHDSPLSQLFVRRAAGRAAAA